MASNYNILYEKIVLERSLVLLLALSNPDYLIQQRHSDADIQVIKDTADGQLSRQKLPIEYFA